MKILVIGRDPKLNDDNSEAFRRVSEYATLFDALHIINIGTGGEMRSYGGKLFIWPVDSRFLGAVCLGRRIVREHGIDIVDAQDPAESGLAAYFVARFAKIPLRLQIHTDIFSPWYKRASLKEWVRYRLAKFLIPRAYSLRAVSERIKNSIQSRFLIPESRISVLPIFTDISKFQNAKRSPETERRFREYNFKMLAIGRFVDKEKNFSMLIEVMRDFIKICPKSLLILVGDGPDRENYKLKITNYKLDRSVIIEKWRDDLPSFLKSFDLFALPSNYEGWGRAVIEAMASGLPVVMTDVGLAGEVIKNGENGLVVPVGDKEAFLGAILDLYKNPEKRKKIALAGLETVKNLEPRTKEEYLLLYRESYKTCLQ